MQDFGDFILLILHALLETANYCPELPYSAILKYEAYPKENVHDTQISLIGTHVPFNTGTPPCHYFHAHAI